MNSCLLMMGGSGVRLGADRPKQFVEIDGKPVFAHILGGLNVDAEIDRIIVVTHQDWTGFVEEWCGRIRADKVYGVVPGGTTRSGSVRNGLKKASEIASEDDIVLIHDATHPYVDHTGMKELVEAVRECGAATMAQRQYDTCYNIDENDLITMVAPRQFVVSGASPEAFRFGDIFRIYMDADDAELDAMTSAGAIALAHGIKMKVCTLHTCNLKITYPEDMEMLRSCAGFFFGEEQGDGKEK